MSNDAKKAPLRALVPQVAPGVDLPIPLPADVRHHLVRVRRLRDGAAVVAFDGKGAEQPAVLRILDSGEVGLISTAPACVTVLNPLHLVLGLPKGPAIDLALRMATELGATHIHPVAAERSQAPREKTDRWTKIIASAATQCRRPDTPTLCPLSDLQTALHRLTGVRLWIAHPGDATQVQVPAPAGQAVLVGPEGGWTSQEVALAAKAGASALQLGDFILRTPTAVAVALSTVQRSP